VAFVRIKFSSRNLFIALLLYSIIAYIVILCTLNIISQAFLYFNTFFELLKNRFSEYAQEIMQKASKK